MRLRFVVPLLLAILAWGVSNVPAHAQELSQELTFRSGTSTVHVTPAYSGVHPNVTPGGFDANGNFRLNPNAFRPDGSVSFRAVATDSFFGRPLQARVRIESLNSDTLSALNMDTILSHNVPLQVQVFDSTGEILVNRNISIQPPAGGSGSPADGGGSSGGGAGSGGGTGSGDDGMGGSGGQGGTGGGGSPSGGSGGQGSTGGGGGQGGAGGPGEGSSSGAGGGSGGGLVSCGRDKPCELRELLLLGVRIFNWLLLVGGAAALLALIVAGTKYILAVFQGADSRAIGEAKQNLLYAMIGLVVLLIAVVVVRTVVTTLGKGAGFPTDYQEAGDLVR